MGAYLTISITLDPLAMEHNMTTELDQYDKKRQRPFLGLLAGMMAVLVVLIVGSFMFIALIFAVVFFFYYLMIAHGYTELEAFATGLMFVVATAVILSIAGARR